MPSALTAVPDQTSTYLSYLIAGTDVHVIATAQRPYRRGSV